MAKFAVMPESDFKNICDSVRAKTKSTAKYKSGDLKSAIDSISLGIDTSDATATAGEIFQGKTAYVNGKKVSGVMPKRGSFSALLTPEYPEVSIPTGFHNGGGTASIQLQEKTVTSSTSDQTVTPDSKKVLSSVTVKAMPTETKEVVPSITAQAVMPTPGKLLSRVVVDPIPPEFVKDGYKVLNGQFEGNGATSYSISCPGFKEIHGLTICADSGNLTGFVNVSTSSLSNKGSSWEITGWASGALWLSSYKIRFSFANEVLTVTPSNPDLPFNMSYDYMIIGR